MKCYLFHRKIVVVYVYPLDGHGHHSNYAHRFLESYGAHDPGIDHDTVIVSNGAPVTPKTQWLFRQMPHVFHVEHDDSGYDIGAYQKCAREIPAEMMVFFGGTSYINAHGWLARMHQAFKRYGMAQYGCMGNRGNLAVNVWPHIRTTAFWMDPELLASYPNVITTPQDRYPFEHGRECFTNWVTSRGLNNWVITRERDLLSKDWDSDPKGFHRGDQSNLLAADRICLPPFYNPHTQKSVLRGLK